MRVAISEEAKRAVTDVAERMDMTEFGVLSRVYEWFGRQPLGVQKWVMGLTRGEDSAEMREFANVVKSAADTAKSEPAIPPLPDEITGDELPPRNSGGRHGTGRPAHPAPKRPGPTR